MPAIIVAARPHPRQEPLLADGALDSGRDLRRTDLAQRSLARIAINMQSVLLAPYPLSAFLRNHKWGGEDSKRRF